MSQPLTKKWLDQLKTPKGGYDKKTLKMLGIDWPPPKGWRKELLKRHGQPVPKRVYRKKAKKGRPALNNPDSPFWKKKRKSLKGVKKYEDFLQTEYWAAVRLKVFRRDKFTCQVCGSKKEIQAHHMTYSIYKKEHLNLSQLMTLCQSCHYEWHCIS